MVEPPKQMSLGRRVARFTRHLAMWTAILLGALFAGAALWIRDTFGPISIDQMLMHLPGAAGAESTGSESSYLQDFLKRAVFFPALVVLCLILTYYFLARRVRSTRDSERSTMKRSSRMAFGAGLLAFAVLLGGVNSFANTVHLVEYAQASAAAESMADYYVSPVSDEQTALEAPTKPKNLITIFLESAEEDFSDKQIFETDMMAPLNPATRDWSKFDTLSMYEGGGWTMAGIIGTECGVPLRGIGDFSFGENHNEIGAEDTTFMPGATCMGDALKRAGYTSEFMGGADAGFAAKRNYLTTHGYDKVMDLSHWQSLGETELSPVWGLSDRRLMENAKQEVTRLHEQQAPFSLTLLTLDIHEPLHIFDSCEVDTVDPAESVQRCSASAVADFVSYLDEMGYLEDTVVFITGDHQKVLAEGNTFTEQLRGKSDRALYNRLWTPDPIEIQRGEIDQLSVYATLLDVLDLGREDGRAGVGVSALIPESEVTGMVALQSEEYKNVIRSRSVDLYRHIWLREKL